MPRYEATINVRVQRTIEIVAPDERSAESKASAWVDDLWSEINLDENVTVTYLGPEDNLEDEDEDEDW